MASFKLKKLVSLSVIGGPIESYTLDERTGFYDKVGANPPVQKGLLDLLFDRMYTPAEVEYNGVLYTLNTPITIGTSTTRVSITRFSIIKNRLFINNNIDATSIRLWVAPVAPPVPTRVLATGETINNFVSLQARIEASYSTVIKLGNATEVFTNPTQTLESFIKNLIFDYNNRFRTCHTPSGREQTSVGRRRSLGDIYMLCKFYYPTCNLHDVIKILYVTLPANTPAFGSIICQTIHKRVFYNYGSSRFDSKTSADEWGNTFDSYITLLNAAPVIIPAPLPVTIVATETTIPENEDLALFNTIKAKFTKGVKFKSVTTGTTFKVDSNNFYNGLRSIILIQEDGSRKQVYDKATRITAKIVS